MANNVVSLSGIPLDILPPARMRQAESLDLLEQLGQQVSGFMVEVGNLHQFALMMDEHGDETLQGVAQHMAVTLKHFDTRLNEIDSLTTEMTTRFRKEVGHG